MLEVRISAYERPELLQRAIESLLRQSCERWSAVVYDDSRSNRVQQYVANLADARVVYVKNQTRLGASQNIDQCFSGYSTSGGQYACILEDDNFMLPGFVEEVHSMFATYNEDIAHFNQRICSAEGTMLPADITTRGRWFSHGRNSPADLKALLLLMEGVSNGGLVWRLDRGVNLQVGASVVETGLHEACRTLLLDRSVRVVDECWLAWTHMEKELTARAAERNRTISRGMQAIRIHVLQTVGLGAVEIARDRAVALEMESRLELNLLQAGYRESTGRLSTTRRFWASGKALALQAVVTNPCGEFLSKARTKNEAVLSSCDHL
jgi:hypothetical protein